MFSTLTDRFFHGMNKKNTKMIQTSNIKASLNSERSRRSSLSRSKQTRLFDITSQQPSMRNSMNKTLRTPSSSEGFMSVQDSFAPPLSFKQNQQYHRYRNVYSKTSSQFAPSISIKQLQQIVGKQDSNQNINEKQLKKGEMKLCSIFSIKDKLRQNIERNAIQKYLDIHYLQNNQGQRQKVDEENIKKMLQLLNKNQNKQKIPHQSIKNPIIQTVNMNKDQQSESQPQSYTSQTNSPQVNDKNNKTSVVKNDKKFFINTQQLIQPLNMQKLNKIQNKQEVPILEQKIVQNDKKNQKQKIHPTGNSQEQKFKIKLPDRGQKPQKQFKQESVSVDYQHRVEKGKTQKILKQSNIKQIKNEQNKGGQMIKSEKIMEVLKEEKKQQQIKLPQTKITKQNKQSNNLQSKQGLIIQVPINKNIQNNKNVQKIKLPKNENKKIQTKVIKEPIKTKVYFNYDEIQQLSQIQLVIKQPQKSKNQGVVKKQGKKNQEIQKISKKNQSLQQNIQKKNTIQQKELIKQKNRQKQITQNPTDNIQPLNKDKNKDKNSQKQKFYDKEQKIEQIQTYSSFINQIGHFSKKTKKFYEKNKVQVFNQEYKTSCFYLWAQMCYLRQKFLKIITQKDEKLFAIEQWILKLPQMKQFLLLQAEKLQQQSQQCQKQLQTFHTNAKPNLSQQQKNLRKDNKIDFYLQCQTILQQQFKQIQKLYKKAVKVSDPNIQLYSERLCIILQIFLLLKFLCRGEQVKQYIPIDQINDMSTHYQNHKHLIVL